jgi:K+-sensing histidine kinase KdpD
VKNGIVVVCVTEQCRCDRLISRGSELARRMDCQLEVISVQPRNAIATRQASVLEYLFGFARRNRAEMRVYYADDPARAVAEWVRRHKVLNIVVGTPGAGSSGFARQLRQLLPDHAIEEYDGQTRGRDPFQTFSGTALQTGLK